MESIVAPLLEAAARDPLERGLRFQPFRISDLEMVSLTFASWNQLDRWLRQVEGLRRAA